MPKLNLQTAVQMKGLGGGEIIALKGPSGILWTKPVAGNDFKVIQGTIVMASGSGTATLTEGTDFSLESGVVSEDWFCYIANNHFTGMGGITGGGNHNLNSHSIYVTYSGDDIVFTRTGGTITRDCRIDYVIVQYIGSEGGSNEIKVRQKSNNSTTGTTHTEAIPVSVTNNNDLVPWVTGQGGNDTTRNDHHSGTFTATINGSNVDFVRGDAADTGFVSWAMLEFTGSDWTVQDVSFVEGGTSGTVAITTLTDVNETFIHDTHRYETTGSAGLDDMSRRVRVTSTTQLTYDSQTATGAADKHHTVYVIENPNISVERLTGTMVGTGEEEVFDVTVTAVAATDRTMTTLSADSTGGGTAFPRGYINHQLTNSTTVRLRQSDNGQASRYSLEVIQLP